MDFVISDSLVLNLQLVHDGDIPDRAGFNDSDAHPAQRLCKVCTRGRRLGDFGEFREAWVVHPC